MPPSAHLLRKYEPNDGLHRSSVAELWHVKGVTGWNADNTRAAVYSVIPRSKGQAHPDITDAICTNFVLRQQISTGVFDATEGSYIQDAIVAVFFSSSHSETVRSRSASTRGFTGSVVVPNWTLTTVADGAFWAYSERLIQREHIRRVETRFVRNGSLTDTVMNQILEKVGWVFHFPYTPSPDPIGDGPDPRGVPYLLKSPTIVDHAPGQSRVIYTFETSCKMIALPADTISGQNIDLPALDYLAEWHAPRGMDVDGSPLPIVATAWWRRYPWSENVLPFL